MPAPKLSREKAQQAMDVVAQYGGVSAAARAINMPRGTLEAQYLIAKQYGLMPGVAPAPDAPTDDLRDRVFELEAQLRSAKTDTITDEYVRRKIIGLTKSVTEARVPTWAVRPVVGDDAMPGVPVTMWSDWHAGEVVDPAQVNGVNEYDMAILDRRSRLLVEKVVYLLRHHVVNPDFPGIVVNLGGDMLSGDIHDELTATNEQPLMPVLLHLFGILKWALGALADEFGRLYVPCVTGNHGRNTKKPRAKDRNYTNFDWLLYQFLAKHFEQDERITFHIPDGPDAIYRVFGHTFLLTHGDQFRGGDGIIGAIGPITRGNSRKLARNSAIGLEYDTMILGHWHQYLPLHRQIVNGSLKGYDEYANANNFGYEPPIQALWLVHPKHGITIQMPVYLEQHAGHQPASDWISWKEVA